MANEKILIVEDSPTEQRLVGTALAGQGYRLVLAADGEEGLQQAVREAPDLIVLDVVLPKVNGYQLCRQLRTLPETKNIKVLMLTSKNQESDRFWGLKQGANEYMTKPFRADELVATVARML